MRVDIRPMGPGDRETWARMRAALRPQEPVEVNAEDLDAMLAGNAIWGFIAETDDGAPAGFAEITIRPFANGCDSRPVPFLEGIWVEAALRRTASARGSSGTWRNSSSRAASARSARTP
jgi:aminoglycoside 6'-N-acetyltransferase I